MPGERAKSCLLLSKTMLDGYNEASGVPGGAIVQAGLVQASALFAVAAALNEIADVLRAQGQTAATQQQGGADDAG